MKEKKEKYTKQKLQVKYRWLVTVRVTAIYLHTPYAFFIRFVLEQLAASGLALNWREVK